MASLQGCALYGLPTNKPKPLLQKQTAVETAVSIHKEDQPGDILIFLTGQDECEAGVERCAERCCPLARALWGLARLTACTAAGSGRPRPDGVRACAGLFPHFARAANSCAPCHCQRPNASPPPHTQPHLPTPAAVKLLEEEGRRLQRSRLKWRLQPVALYAGLPAAHQLGVFEPAPRGVRKVGAWGGHLHLRRLCMWRLRLLRISKATARHALDASHGRLQPEVCFAASTRS